MYVCVVSPDFNNFLLIQKKAWTSKEKCIYMKRRRDTEPEYKERCRQSNLRSYHKCKDELRKRGSVFRIEKLIDGTYTTIYEKRIDRNVVC